MAPANPRTRPSQRRRLTVAPTLQGRDLADKDQSRADDDGVFTRRHAGLEGDMAQVEIDDLHQETGDGDVKCGAALGQDGLKNCDQGQRNQHGDHVEQSQKREGSGMLKADSCYCKARRPEKEKDDRNGDQTDRLVSLSQPDVGQGLGQGRRQWVILDAGCGQVAGAILLV